MRYLPFKKIHIESKLKLLMMLVSTIVLILACWAFVINKYASFKDTTGEYLLSLTNEMNDNLSAALLSEDNEAAHRILSSLSSDTHIIGASLYDQSGSRFTSYIRDGQGKNFSTPVIKKEGLSFSLIYAEILEPIISSDVQIATIYIRRNTSDFYNRALQSFFISIVIVIWLVLFSYLFSSYLLTAISEPIILLLRRIRRATYRRVASRKVVHKSDEPIRATQDDVGYSEDEIGELSTHFNYLLREIKALDELNREDELTGLHNRRGFTAMSAQLLKISKRQNKDLSFIFMDLDHFKLINDTYGHRVGDKFLMDTAEIIRTTFRESDICARIGGDEFAAAVPDCDKEHLATIIARLRKKIKKYNEASSGSHSLDISFGTTTWKSDEPIKVDDLLDEADRMMYQEKIGKRERGDS